MTRREAQEILLSYRPGAEPLDEPQVAEALDLVRTDPELSAWYEQHRAWDNAVRQKLSALPVPADLKASILAGEKIVAGPAHWWNRRAAVLAAAAVIALLMIVGVMIARRSPTSTDTFAQYRTNVIGIVLREYRMDRQTADTNEIRGFFADQRAPADYVVPAGLQKLKPEGCGKLLWRGKPVSMLCFLDEREQLVWLFVAKATHWPDPPPAQPVFARVIACGTLSWSDGESVYMIAAENSESALRKLL